MTLSCVCADAAQVIAASAGPATAPTTAVRLVMPIMTSSLAGMHLFRDIVASPKGSSFDDLPRLAERRLHLSAHLDCERAGIIGDIRPFEALAFGNVALEADVLRKPERQQTLSERARARDLLAVDAVAALSIEHLASFERALGGGDHVGAPAAFGLHTSASSKRDAGGKLKPSLCGTSPVTLHTAVISIADLVPSTKLLNIFGLIEPRSSMCRYLSRMSHTVSGVERW